MEHTDDLSASTSARLRLPVAARLLCEEPDVLRRLTDAVTMQRELGMILRDDAREALAAGHSWRDVARATRMPVATLHRIMATNLPVSAIRARRGH